MANAEFLFELSTARRAICAAYRMDEAACLQQLLSIAKSDPKTLENTANLAKKLILDIRSRAGQKVGLDGFLAEYDLSSIEGIALMCMTESMLRIPDGDTIDKLIQDKISAGDWEQHLGHSPSMFVNAATWALLLTGKVLDPQATAASGLTAVLRRWLQNTSAPLIRAAMLQAMKILGQQFVMGQSIEAAIKRAAALEAKGYTYSYDMLGEEARTQADADRYFANYMQAIAAIGANNHGKNPYTGAGISVKLSALHPRFEWRQRARVLRELLPKVRALVQAAASSNIGFTIDAEEAERLDLSLDIFAELMPEVGAWQGLGLAVQAYQKRAPLVIDFIAALARQHKCRIMLRLVKGAYWDSEIKWAQEKGLNGYPVFTRKAATDVSYIACVKKLLAATDAFYPQFATHNAYTVALIINLAANYKDFEFQCLHGMGDALYANIVQGEHFQYPCRVYAPVGSHRDLLPYLVRRLLENGANTSFVNQIIDQHASLDELVGDPCARINTVAGRPHPRIPLPVNIYGDARLNSRGIDFTNPLEYQGVLQKFNALASMPPAAPVLDLDPKQVTDTIARAYNAVSSWKKTAIALRVQCLLRMAELLEEQQAELMYLIISEGHRTINDAMSEVREAIDFCRYYALRARIDFAVETLPGPTGELNKYALHGRGVVACISPWNFPLAIFLGQVSAALLAGNVVLAKPAAQTPSIAAKAIALLHAAGVPSDVVQLVPGSGRTVGEALIHDLRIHGYIFTGSTATARRINQVLAAREGAIIPLIAETGGQNAMLVDSSALPEQVVNDVVSSAFGSAGQRCSSLRVLFLQQEIADHIIKMLAGAMAELKLGDPMELSTDIGPIIDVAAVQNLKQHLAWLQANAKLIYACKLLDGLTGNFFAPCAFEIQSIQQLTSEVFGPILHVVRYAAKDLDRIIAEINATGYGLTLGIHSRITQTVQYIIDRVQVGNIYVNRNMIGAVVGVQPFGGEGLSGTGPKAGGPHYLPRLANEQAISTNIAAAGGNTSLLCLEE